MNVRLVSPRDNIMTVLASMLRPAGKDYSRHWVVFPEKRPSYYLRRTLAEKERSSFIPPLLDSMDGFIDRVYTELLGHKEKPIDPLDAVALLFEIHKESSIPMGGGHFLSADSFFSLGAKIFNDLEELNMTGARKDDILAVQVFWEESVPREALGRLQSLAHFFERFYALLREKGFSSPSSRFREVLDRLQPDLFEDFEQLIFAGFFSLTKMETRLLKTIMSWDKGQVVFMKGRGLRSVLSGLEVADKDLLDGCDSVESQPPVEFFKSPDTHGQIFALNKVLEENLKDPARLNERQVIVLPAAETLFPLYEQTLSGLAEEDYNISLGYPLVRTPVYSFFDKLLELIQSRDEGGRIYAPHYLRFVLHPYAKNIYFPGSPQRADLTRILIHAVEDELQGRRLKTFWTLEELESDRDIMRSLQGRTEKMENAPAVAEFMDHLRSIHASTIGLFREIRDVGDFAGKLIAILNYIYENSTARLHPFFHPYAEAFMMRLDALRRSLLNTTVFEDLSGYFNLFRKVIQAGSVPFLGTPLRGLQVLGFWEARCIQFEEVSILDMNEEVIPAFRREDTLLPFAARKALGLPTYEDQERRLEYYLEALLQGAKRARLFFVENNDKEKSRFVEKLIWERQKREAEPRAERYVRTIRYRVALQSERPKPMPKTPAMAEFLAGRRFSSTALDKYLRCPLKFYYDYVLGLEEKEEITERLERKDIGTFVHAVLEEFFQPLKGKTLRREALDKRRLKAVIDRRFRNDFGGDLAGSAYLLRLQTGRHLEEFLTGYQAQLLKELAEQGKQLKILGLEQSWPAELAFRGKTFSLVARVDRTELRGQDHFILDYKTGGSEGYLKINFDKLDPADRETWSDAIGSLQLPLYNLVSAKIYQKTPEQIRCRLLMLGKNVLTPKIEFSPFDEEDDDARRRQLGLMEHIIGELLAEIADPEKPFDPTLQSSKLCPACPFRYLCKTS